MVAKAFEVGDVVRLNGSDAETMTVEGFSPTGDVQCVWFVSSRSRHGRLVRDVFPPGVLRKVEKRA